MKTPSTPHPDYGVRPLANEAFTSRGLYEFAGDADRSMGSNPAHSPTKTLLDTPHRSPVTLLTRGVCPPSTAPVHGQFWSTNRGLPERQSRSSRALTEDLRTSADRLTLVRCSSSGTPPQWFDSTIHAKRSLGLARPVRTSRHTSIAVRRRNGGHTSA